jgi:hypothetical protein
MEEFQHADRAAARQPSRLRYRPAVFFSQRRLISLSFPQGKIRRALKKCYQFHVLLLF